jgi:general stress protein YciG
MLKIANKLTAWQAIGPVTFNPHNADMEFSSGRVPHIKETVKMASSNKDNQGGKGSDNPSGKQGGKSERGFAAMDPSRQREIASEGGKAAHQSGNAHEFTSEEAREAGRKGGQASGGNQGGKQQQR